MSTAKRQNIALLFFSDYSDSLNPLIDKFFIKLCNSGPCILIELVKEQIITFLTATFLPLMAWSWDKTVVKVSTSTKTTNANPLDLPVIWSIFKFTEATSPNLPKYSEMSCCVTWKIETNLHANYFMQKYFSTQLLR